MENATIAYLQPLIPECAGARMEGDFDIKSSGDFDPTSWDYYRSQVLPAAIAGSVFGILAFIAFLALLVYIIYKYCRCCCRSKPNSKSTDASPPTSEFIKSSSPSFDAPGVVSISPETTPTITKPSFSESVKTCAKNTSILQWVLAFFGLATIGLCLWGIPESLNQTDTQINEFWELVDSIDHAQGNTSAILASLSGQMNVLGESLQQISTSSDRITALLTPLGGFGNAVGLGIAELETAAGGVDTAQGAIDTGVTAIDTYVGGSIDGLKDDFKSPTQTFQGRGRVIAIVVIFGFIILCSPVCIWASWKMKHPIILASCTAANLFFVFLVLLLGSGVVRGVQNVSTDGCLYTETFVYNILLKKIENPRKEVWLEKALKFYLNPAVPNGTDSPGAVQEILNLDFSGIFDVLQSVPVGQLLSVINSTIAQTAMRVTLEPETAQALTNLATITQPALETIEDLNVAMSREKNFALYLQAKELICCHFATAARMLFICWTCIGAIAFAFSLLCIWRLLKHNREMKRAALNIESGSAAVSPVFDSVKSVIPADVVAVAVEDAVESAPPLSSKVEAPIDAPAPITAVIDAVDGKVAV